MCAIFSVGNRVDLLLITEESNPQITLPEEMNPIPPLPSENDISDEVSISFSYLS